MPPVQADREAELHPEVQEDGQRCQRGNDRRPDPRGGPEQRGRVQEREEDHDREEDAEADQERGDALPLGRLLASLVEGQVEIWAEEKAEEDHGGERREVRRGEERGRWAHREIGRQQEPRRAREGRREETRGEPTRPARFAGDPPGGEQHDDPRDEGEGRQPCAFRSQGRPPQEEPLERDRHQ